MAGTLTIQSTNQSALVLSAASPLTYNQSEPLNISGGSTGGAITYNVTGPCSAANGQLKANSSTGSCTVSATMAGNSSYSPVTSNSVTVTLQPANQATLTLTAASPLTYNQSETLSVTGGTDGGLITYTATGSAGVTCSIASGKLSANSGTGTCTVSATMAGNSNYNPVTSNSVIVALQVAAQTINFTTNPPPSAAYNSQFTVGATASSGLAISFTSAGGCTNTSTTLTSGVYKSTYTMTSSTVACSVIANQAGNANYQAQTVTKTVTATGPAITVSPTSINFGTVTLGSITTKTVTVSNTGNAAVTISTPLLSLLRAGNANEFVIVNLCPSSLAAGKSCTITVSFVAGAYYNTAANRNARDYGQCAGQSAACRAECDCSATADDHLHHQPTGECRLQQQLHGGGLGLERARGDLHQFRSVQQFRRNLHDDQRHGNLLGDRQPGRQLQLRGGGAGYEDRNRDSGPADDHVHHQPSGERCLQEQLHGGGYGRRQRERGDLHQFRSVQQFREPTR